MITVSGNIAHGRPPDRHKSIAAATPSRNNNISYVRREFNRFSILSNDTNDLSKELSWEHSQPSKIENVKNFKLYCQPIVDKSYHPIHEKWTTVKNGNNELRTSKNTKNNESKQHSPKSVILHALSPELKKSEVLNASKKCNGSTDLNNNLTNDKMSEMSSEIPSYPNLPHNFSTNNCENRIKNYPRRRHQRKLPSLLMMSLLHLIA